jgi:hypothetical protein
MNNTNKTNNVVRNVVRAVARRGRKGDVILVIDDGYMKGKIAFPRNFIPREYDWYYVEVEDRGRYAFAYLHRHLENDVGICPACESVVSYEKLRSFASRWIENMLNYERIKRIKEGEEVALGYFDALIGDIDGMIERLDKAARPHRRSVNMCPPGYPVVDSCFADLCADQECTQLEAAIVYLERVREELAERRRRAVRALESDRVVTVTPLGVERIFVPGI